MLSKGAINSIKVCHFSKEWMNLSKKMFKQIHKNEYTTENKNLPVIKVSLFKKIDAEFPCCVPDHKIVLFWSAILWSHHARTGTKQGNSAKSTNNPMSSFGFIE